MKLPKYLRLIFVLAAVLIGLFLSPHTILAGCNYLTCSECVANSDCIWAINPEVCMTKSDASGFNPSGLTSYCGSTNYSERTTTNAKDCRNVTSCTECVNRKECFWCYDACENWDTSSSICQMHAFSSPDQCYSNSNNTVPTAIPTTIPTVRFLPTFTPAPTQTPAPKKENGQACQVNSDCQSGNCTNYVCCLKSKTCCAQSNFCPKDQYCSTSNNRHYCIPKLDNGISCTDYEQCKSNQCGKGICCAGQPCCKVDADCGKDEYCETKDNLYYCRVKWNIGERCEKPLACRSDYCDTYTQKCAEDPKKITPTPKKARCGDNSCDDWLGENCCNCPGDCASIADFCCAQNSKYASSRDRQNNIFYLYNAPGGAIPNGRLIVPEKIEEKIYFSSYQPKICQNGKIIEGECFKSDQCVEGICVDNKCTTASSSEPQEVKDEKTAQEIYNDQIEYLKEDIWINVYDKIKGDIITSTRVEGNLEISLEVQGATAGKAPEVKVGNTVENRLRIVNSTNYSMAIIAGIVYPGQLANSFHLEEKKYTLSCSRIDGQNPLTSIIGTANAKRLGGQYYLLPSNHQLIIYSNVVPEQEGYLDVSGVVYYSKEKMYANSPLWQMATAPVNFETSFQKAEVSKSVLVTKKKCGWLFCL